MLKPVFQMYKDYFMGNTINIELSLNIDKLPISRSSKSAFRPILLSIVNVPILMNKIFPIGIYHSI